MSFKVKNSQLSNDALKSINRLIEEDINASVAFKLTRIIKHLSEIVEIKIDSEKKIWDKWTKRGEDGKPLTPKDDDGNPIKDAVMIDNVDEFSKEMSELLNIENEIPFDKIKFEDLGLKTVKVKDLIKIEFLFDIGD